MGLFDLVGDILEVGVRTVTTATSATVDFATLGQLREIWGESLTEEQAAKLIAAMKRVIK
jgi:hypothetical protein